MDLKFAPIILAMLILALFIGGYLLRNTHKELESECEIKGGYFLTSERICLDNSSIIPLTKP
jgi:hypothetical protein